MSQNNANYPAAIWDGTTPTRSSRLIDAAPEGEDWDQISAEVIATQTQLDTVNGALTGQDAIPPLTDSSTGTPDLTISPLVGSVLATDAAIANDNFAEVNDQINLILVALEAAGIILAV